jgi:hypothetical protein
MFITVSLSPSYVFVNPMQCAAASLQPRGWQMAANGTVIRLSLWAMGVWGPATQREITKAPLRQLVQLPTRSTSHPAAHTVSSVAIRDEMCNSNGRAVTDVYKSNGGNDWSLVHAQ